MFARITALLFCTVFTLSSTAGAQGYLKEKPLSTAELEKRVAALRELFEWMRQDDADRSLESSKPRSPLRRVLGQPTNVTKGLSKLGTSNLEDDLKRHDFLLKISNEIHRNPSLYIDDYLSWYEDALAARTDGYIGFRLYGAPGLHVDQLDEDIKQLAGPEYQRLEALDRSVRPRRPKVLHESNTRVRATSGPSPLDRTFSEAAENQIAKDRLALQQRLAAVDAIVTAGLNPAAEPDVAKAQLAAAKAELASVEDEIRNFESDVFALRHSTEHPRGPVGSEAKLMVPKLTLSTTEADYAAKVARDAVEERLLQLKSLPRSAATDTSIRETQVELAQLDFEIAVRKPKGSVRRMLDNVKNMLMHYRPAPGPGTVPAADAKLAGRELAPTREGSEETRKVIEANIERARRDRAAAREGIEGRLESAIAERTAILDKILPGYTYLEAQHNDYIAKIARAGKEIIERQNFEAMVEAGGPRVNLRDSEADSWRRLRELSIDLRTARYLPADEAAALKSQHAATLDKLRSLNADGLRAATENKAELIRGFTAHEDKMHRQRLGLDTSPLDERIAQLEKFKTQPGVNAAEIEARLAEVRELRRYVGRRRPLALNHYENNPFLVRYQSPAPVARPMEAIKHAAVSTCNYLVERAREAAPSLFTY